MISRQQFLDSVSREINIIKHLYTKIPAGTLDFRPSEKQRSTMELLRYLAASGGQPVAGIRMGIHPDKTPGTTLIKGVAFDSTRTYKVVTSDYLANGGDKMDFFKSPLKLETTGYKIRDAILDYLAEQQKNNLTIQPALDGRMYYETK